MVVKPLNGETNHPKTSKVWHKAAAAVPHAVKCKEDLREKEKKANESQANNMRYRQAGWPDDNDHDAGNAGTGVENVAASKSTKNDNVNHFFHPFFSDCKAHSVSMLFYLSHTI